MARLGCKCGAIMGTSECPSPYSLDIFYDSEIQSALADDPCLKLNDFLTGWSEKEGCQRNYQHRKTPVEYWYCTECHRVYEVQAIPRGRWLRIYNRSDTVIDADYSTWKKIFVMPDTVTDASTEENWEITLDDYLKQHDSVRYYLSPDETIVLAEDSKSLKPLFCYRLEDAWSPPA